MILQPVIGHYAYIQVFVSELKLETSITEPDSDRSNRGHTSNGRKKMRKILSLFLLLLLSSMMIAMPASAKTGAPVGGCAPGYELLSYMDSCSAMPMHIGLDVDLNGDGLICMQVVTPTLHVHVDNTYPLR